MPSRLLSPSGGPRPPEFSAACAASLSSRSMGTWPTPAKNILEKNPLMPGVVKYSALARKVTLRGISTGMKNESQKERWLLARMAGRSSGMFSRPAIQGRQRRRRRGPRKMNLASQNPTVSPAPPEICGPPHPRTDTSAPAAAPPTAAPAQVARAGTGRHNEPDPTRPAWRSRVEWIADAEPFAADRGPIGVVVSHGFTGTPASVRPWAEHLAAAGYSGRLAPVPGPGATRARRLQRPAAAVAGARRHVAGDEPVALAAVVRDGRGELPRTRRPLRARLRRRALDGRHPRDPARRAAPGRHRRAGARQPRLRHPTPRCETRALHLVGGQ